MHKRLVHASALIHAQYYICIVVVSYLTTIIIGGFVTEAVFDIIGRHGRIVICGQISTYNNAEGNIYPNYLAKTIYRHSLIGLRPYLCGHVQACHTSFAVPLRCGDHSSHHYVATQTRSGSSGYVGALP